MTRVILVIAVVALLVGIACSGGGSPNGDVHATSAFFDRFVTDGGRVVRHDQGGDTVSEGQAYAMLLAVADDDAAQFDRVWRWTQQHLQRDDGLFAWHWSGHVVDDSPAGDADIDIAHALLRAAEKFDDDRLHDAGARVAKAVLDHETVSRGSNLVLAAGPWAVDTRTVNPSYLATCAFSDLAELTGDERWVKVRDGSIDVLRDLLKDDPLPPDWARLRDDGRVEPIGAPGDPSAPPRYGLDAVRVAIRLGSCDATKDLAASMWPRLQKLAGGGAHIAYALDGRSVDDATNAAGLVGAAAAATAADDSSAARGLLDRAADLERRHPTYYGAALLALGGRTDEERTLSLVTTPIAEVAQETTTTTTSPATTTTSTSSPTSTTTVKPTTTSTTTAKSTTSTTTPASSTSSSSSSTTVASSTPTTARRSAVTHVRSTTTTTARERGALSSQTPQVDELLSPRRRQTSAQATDSRGRATGAIVGVGAALAVVLGIAFGLRERRHVRRFGGPSPSG